MVEHFASHNPYKTAAICGLLAAALIGWLWRTR